ncbi:MAG: PKD domain-containing protein [Reichenbachiella sp.]
MTKESTVLAAVRSTSGNSGVWRSVDGGDTWSKVINSSAADIEVTKDKIYASTFNGTVHVSDNEGESWTTITPASNADRVELGVAYDHSNIIYALGNEENDAIWLYKSSDGGVTWTEVSIPKYISQNCSPSSDPFTRQQGWYDLILAVSPDNPSMIVVGGVDLFRSFDSGATWESISYWTGGCDDYVHADQHNFLFRPGRPEEAICSNDGGVYYSSSISTTDTDGPDFESRNNGYNVSQFYACAMTNVSLSNAFLAGAQDNGTHLYNGFGINSTIEVTGGDGAYCFIDQDDASLMVSSYVFNNYYLSTDGMNSSSSFGEGDESGQFINPTAYDSRTNTLFAAGNANELIIYTGLETGSVTTMVKNVTINSEEVSSITLSISDEEVVFVGTYSGSVYRISNVFNDSPISELLLNSSGTVATVDVGSSDDQLLVIYSNYGVTSVFETRDGGTTWFNKEGNLPDMPIRWGLYNPNNTNEVLLATEMGVWSVDDITDTDIVWEPSNDGFANVSCYMLQYRASDGVVAVATHGRGLFTSDIFSDPMANFYTDVQVGYTGLSVQFIDASLKASSYLWDFGDGGTAITANPLHIYEEPGLYEVSLEIDGDETNTQSIMLQILPYLDADFSLADGGDFESKDTLFTAVNIAGTGFELGSSSVGGKSGVNSGENAWVTGINSTVYDPWSEAYLYTPAFDFSVSGSYSIEFFTKYELEDEWDGFIIEYTVDGGVSWLKLGEELDDLWYNQEAIGGAVVFEGAKPFFSGSTGGQFVKKSLDISFLSNNEIVAFRYSFKSDPASEKAGIAIDDFVIIAPDLETEIDFNSTSTSICTGQGLIITNTSTGDVVSYSWDFGDDSLPPTAEGYGPFEVSYTASGNKSIVLTATTADGIVISSLDVDVVDVPQDKEYVGDVLVCKNNQAEVTVIGSEVGVSYYLIDGLDQQMLLSDSVLGNGSDIVLTTTPLLESVIGRVIGSFNNACETTLSKSLEIEVIELDEFQLFQNSELELEVAIEGEVSQYTWYLNNEVIIEAEVSQYTWYLNNEVIIEAEGNTYLPTENGSYKVEAFIRGCSVTSESVDYLILELKGELTFEIFPNPCHDYLHVKYDENILGVQVVNLIGVNIELKTELGQGGVKLDMSGLTNGVYLINVLTSSGSFSKRVLKR